LADAQIDSTPMVCITGQGGSHLLGSDAFQETDIGAYHSCDQVELSNNLKLRKFQPLWQRPFYIAKSGRPWSRLIDIPPKSPI